MNLKIKQYKVCKRAHKGKKRIKDINETILVSCGATSVNLILMYLKDIREAWKKILEKIVI